MKICPNADCLVGSATAGFCRNCGTLLVEAPPDRPPVNFPCPFCKASVLPQDNFCGTCGHPVPQKKGEQR